MLLIGQVGKTRVGVCGVEGINYFKIKGCGENACPTTRKLACVLFTVAYSLDGLTKSNPDGILLILNTD